MATIALYLCPSSAAYAKTTELVWCVNKKGRLNTHVLERTGGRTRRYSAVPGMYIAHGKKLYMRVTEKKESKKHHVPGCWKKGKRLRINCGSQAAWSTCACNYSVQIHHTYMYDMITDRRTLISGEAEGLMKDEGANAERCVRYTENSLLSRGSLGPWLFFVVFDLPSYCNVPDNTCPMHYPKMPCCYGSLAVDLTRIGKRDDPTVAITKAVRAAEMDHVMNRNRSQMHRFMVSSLHTRCSPESRSRKPPPKQQPREPPPKDDLGLNPYLKQE